MKYFKNKFVIFISLIALINTSFIFSKYNWKSFVGPSKPLNKFDEKLIIFKNKYSFLNLKTIGFYSDAKGDGRIHVLYELQDSIMPIFIDDSINHDYVLCFTYANSCGNFAAKENMKIEGIFHDIFLCKRKDKK